jgi:hypothetical protein
MLVFAICFDAVVPFETTPTGLLQLDDELEEAAQLRARRDHSRDARATTRARAAALRDMSLPRVRRPAPRPSVASRAETPPRPLPAADPGAAPPPGGDDH